MSVKLRETGSITYTISLPKKKRGERKEETEKGAGVSLGKKAKQGRSTGTVCSWL
jgi:hypothetical protein